MAVGSHSLLFGARELGVEKLWWFREDNAQALDVLADVAKSLASTTPERVAEVLRMGDAAGRDFDRFRELLRKWHLPEPFGKKRLIPKSRPGHVAALKIVVDVDERAAEVWLRSGGKRKLAVALHMPWPELLTWSERATHCDRIWREVMRDEATLDRRAALEEDVSWLMATLRPFVVTTLK